ncbi:hypothetical protein [Clostridium sp. Marseille-P299]|uniref:hypothetical protein n=1 Tax=Clostridium sp. Marseille-P299 TaxID=1805477 RepID=UPI0008354D34|nr:hypothetical protein [Clostridium sp. Marseille-P299]
METQSIRINIEGLQFNETQERVRNQIEGIIGVTNVKLSEGQDYVDVDFDEQTSVQEISNHLQNNGYKILDFD